MSVNSKQNNQYRINDDFMINTINSVHILFNSKNDRFYEVSASTKLLLEGINEGLSQDSLAQKLSEHYKHPFSIQMMKEQIKIALQDLQKYKIILKNQVNIYVKNL